MNTVGLGMYIKFEWYKVKGYLIKFHMYEYAQVPEASPANFQLTYVDCWNCDP